MSKFKYHNKDLSELSFLVTGGAGFIGSNIVEYLLKNGAKRVRVFDNLSNGYLENIESFFEYKNFEFIEGDIRDIEKCKEAIEGMQYVSHQAALGSVPRSIQDPALTTLVNISGFVNMMVAAKDSKSVKRFVYAASSSTYGDSKELPKIEGHEGKPLSPYAITKAVNEQYGDVFSKVYGFHTIGLRYFNVFGPNQNPNNPYAAVIPLFCKAFIDNESPKIFGDGETSRDFTFVDNAVQANIKAMLFEPLTSHEVFNVACGENTSLNEMIQRLNNLTNKGIIPLYEKERIGDVKHSLASIDKIKGILDYDPKYTFNEGLEIAFEWYNKKYAK